MMKSVIINMVSITTHFGWRDMLRTFGYQQESLLPDYKELFNKEFWSEWHKGNLSSEAVVNNRKTENIVQRLGDMINHIDVLEKQAIETEKWIALLKQRGYKVYLCTSFPMAGLRSRLKLQDLVVELAEVDGQLVSEYKNMDTPSPDSYRRLLQMYGLKAEECIFIDDHMENIEAAKAEGMHTITFNSYEEVTDEIDRWMKKKVFEERID